MVPAIHHPTWPPPPLAAAAWAPTLPWLGGSFPAAPELDAAAALDAAAIGAPHPVQNRAPGFAFVPHASQVRPPRAAPQDAQKFPLAVAPHRGQVFSVISMSDSGSGAISISGADADRWAAAVPEGAGQAGGRVDRSGSSACRRCVHPVTDCAR